MWRAVFWIANGVILHKMVTSKKGKETIHKIEQYAQNFISTVACLTIKKLSMEKSKNV